MRSPHKFTGIADPVAKRQTAFIQPPHMGEPPLWYGGDTLEAFIVDAKAKGVTIGETELQALLQTLDVDPSALPAIEQQVRDSGLVVADVEG